jgi:hypothetical protein
MSGPEPRELGRMIGAALGHFPIGQFIAVSSDEVFMAAGITREALSDEYLLLIAAAALDAIETSALPADVENDAAQGLYDWFRALPGTLPAFLRDHIEWAVEAYGAAAGDDAASPAAAGSFSELELEFLDRLLSLGQPTPERQHACLRLGAVLPAHFWPVHVGSASQMLLDAGYLSQRDA